MTESTINISINQKSILTDGNIKKTESIQANIEDPHENIYIKNLTVNIFNENNSKITFTIKINGEDSNQLRNIIHKNLNKISEELLPKEREEHLSLFSKGVNAAKEKIENSQPFQKIENSLPVQGIEKYRVNHEMENYIAKANHMYLETLFDINSKSPHDGVSFQVTPTRDESYDKMNDLQKKENDLLAIVGLTILTVAVGFIIVSHFTKKSRLLSKNQSTNYYPTTQTRQNTQHKALFISSYTEEVNFEEIEENIKRNGSSALDQIKQCTHVSHIDTHIDPSNDKNDPEFLLIEIKDPQQKTEGLAKGIFDSQTDEYIRTEGYKSAKVYRVSANFVEDPALKIKLRKS